MKLSNEAIEVLVKTTIENDVVILPNIVLERDLYLEVSRALSFIGGKWSRGKGGFIFAKNENPAEKLGILIGKIETGESVKSEQQIFQFFPTPKNLAERMVQYAGITADSNVVEPSAGQGAIIDEVYPITSSVTAVELNTINCDIIRERYPSIELIQGDFLQQVPEEKFDAVIMNPPFSKHQALAHILHAFKFLKPWGTLVSICEAGISYRNDKKTEKFGEFLMDTNAEVIDLPAGTFKASGTMVAAKLIVIHKSN